MLTNRLSKRDCGAIYIVLLACNSALAYFFIYYCNVVGFMLYMLLMPFLFMCEQTNQSLDAAEPEIDSCQAANQW